MPIFTIKALFISKAKVLWIKTGYLWWKRTFSDQKWIIISPKWAFFYPNRIFLSKIPFFNWKLILIFRQNEFTVMSGRKKAVRRIFLFENLILFTKPKRTTQGGDVYQYKNSWLVSFRTFFRKFSKIANFKILTDF